MVLWVLESLQGNYLSSLSFQVNCSLGLFILEVIFLLAVTWTKQVAELHGLQADFLISLFQEPHYGWIAGVSVKQVMSNRRQRKTFKSSTSLDIILESAL